MRYLGLDLGSKTLGISISDTTLTIANILKTIYFDVLSFSYYNVMWLGFPNSFSGKFFY